MEADVRELLVEQLKDAYSAERQALRCMQKTLKMASSPALREGIQLHIEQTQTQIERVEQAMEKLEIRPGRKVCEAMRGLVEETQHEIGEQALGEQEVVELLSATLEEEKETDLKLTEITEQSIMPEAMGGDRDKGEEAPSRRKSGSSRSKAA